MAESTENLWGMCDNCFLPKPKVYHNKKLSARLCRSCYNELHTAICTRCGLDERIARRIDGKPFCIHCYPFIKEKGICKRCRKKKDIFAYGECVACYRWGNRNGHSSLVPQTTTTETASP